VCVIRSTYQAVKLLMVFYKCVTLKELDKKLIMRIQTMLMVNILII